MGIHHLVRVGALARVGRFTSVDGVRYPRRSRVIVRTSRGLEIGEVLAPPGDDTGTGDGSILRGMTVEDHLLADRLERNRDQACQACSARIAELGLPTTLLDVEQLFDGSTLWFYFLGPTSPELEALTDELAEVYEAQAQFRRFAEAVNTGCGPGCGTEEGAGCGSACSSGCALAGACSSHR